MQSLCQAEGVASDYKTCLVLANKIAVTCREDLFDIALKHTQ